MRRRCSKAWSPFEREISVIVVRGQDGALAFYDPVENVHQNGILAISRAPARIAQSTAAAAKAIAGKVADALGHVGRALRGDVRARRTKARSSSSTSSPRASTIRAIGRSMPALVSQFENHVRAICGWPLGDTARHSDAVMTNLIGDDVEKWRALAAEPGTAVHLYGKAEARPGRKMGHVTRLYPKS